MFETTSLEEAFYAHCAEYNGKTEVAKCTRLLGLLLASSRKRLQVLSRRLRSSSVLFGRLIIGISDSSELPLKDDKRSGYAINASM